MKRFWILSSFVAALIHPENKSIVPLLCVVAAVGGGSCGIFNPSHFSYQAISTRLLFVLVEHVFFCKDFFISLV